MFLSKFLSFFKKLIPCINKKEENQPPTANFYIEEDDSNEDIQLLLDKLNDEIEKNHSIFKKLPSPK